MPFFFHRRNDTPDSPGDKSGGNAPARKPRMPFRRVRINLRFQGFSVYPRHMSDLATVPLLLVEDNEEDAFILRHAFRSLSLTNPLFVARDGEDAIRYLSGQSPYANRAEFPLPYLILLDLKMPGMDGFDVLRFIRSDRVLRHLFVIVMTSSELNHDVAAAYALGADSYLVKSSDPSNLGEIFELLGRHWETLERLVEFRREDRTSAVAS